MESEGRMKMNLRKMILLAAAAAVLALAGYFLFLQPDGDTSTIIPANNDTTNNNTTNNTDTTTPSLEAPVSKFKDGTYTGEGEGKNGPVTVSVTIAGDRITDIVILTSFDEDKYFSRAEAMIPGSILAAQSTEVDVCSGATFSSEGIIAAVEDALAKAQVK